MPMKKGCVKVDLASLVGMIVCIVLVVYGMIDSAGGIGGINYFLNLPSALITFGGSFFCDNDVGKHGKLCWWYEEYCVDFQASERQCSRDDHQNYRTV